MPNLTGTMYSVFSGSGIAKVVNLGQVTKIEGYNNEINAFAKCLNLTDVTLPDTLETIGAYAFYECTALSNINFPNKISTIGAQAFYNCTSLEIEDLSLPNLTTLGQNAFYGVKIKKISNLGKITTLPTSTTSTQNFGDKDVLEEVVIPDGVTQLDGTAFASYTKLKNVIARNCKTGNDTFYKCTSLESIIIGSTPADAPNTSHGTFFSCTSLKNVEFTDETATTIGAFTFYKCSALETITLPLSTTTISRFAFGECTKFKGIDNWDAIAPNLTYIGRYSLANCSLQLTDLSLPNLETLGGWAFSGANNNIVRVLDLGKISTLPRTDSGMFKNATLLILPSTLETIEAWGITKMPNLQTLIVKAVTPPSIGGYIDIKASAIYVPDASVEAYKAASGWSSYASRIKPLSDYVES